MRDMSGHEGRHGRWSGPGGPPWGGGRGRGWGGRPHGHGPGHRFGRGGIRVVILELLSQGPRHGYDIIRAIGERTGGMWQPSPGSVYPTLQQLEDEGLVSAEASDGRRVYALTESGRAEAEQNRERHGEIWRRLSQGGMDDHRPRLYDLSRQAMGAVMQVAREGTDAQIDEAAGVLADARRQLYRILGEGSPETP
jgi:DNA-binding PadR family transcriptional regulator